MEPREEFVKDVLSRYYGHGVGAEIGVYYGEFSRIILKYYPGTLLMVDSWKAGYFDEPSMEEVYKRCVQSMQGCRRHVILRGDSLHIATHVPDNSLDFVYIDADHTYRGCMDDINIWVPKVKRHGLIAGHDYMVNNMFDYPKGNREVWEVKKAVDEVFGKVNVVADEFGTWWTEKRD